MVPAVGDLYSYPNGYSFYETFHGPFELVSCVDCGKTPIATEGRGADGVWPRPDRTPRCTGCARKHHGLD